MTLNVEPAVRIGANIEQHIHLRLRWHMEQTQ